MENKFIIVVVITLLLIALGQLMKVYDLASRSRGDRSEEKVTKGENIFDLDEKTLVAVMKTTKKVALIF